MEIFVKNIKLSDNSKAIIKSKWFKDTIKLNFLVQDEDCGTWKIYTGECTDEDIRQQSNLVNIPYETMKGYMTLETDTDDGNMYKIESNKFTVFIKDYCGSDSADVILFEQDLDCEEISMKILLEQVNDIKNLTTELNRKNELIEKNNARIQKLAETYDDLILKKQEFDVKFYNKAVHLVNTKKKYIQQHIINNTSEMNAGQSLESKNKNFDDANIPSTSRTPTKRLSSSYSNRTPHKKTPSKSTTRTPSKRLRELQDMSDSDDCFAVLSIDNIANKFSSKAVNDSLDSSRVFKDFKIKTPIKRKEEKRESSVELKIERNTNEIESNSESEKSKSSETKASNYQNAQQIDQPSTPGTPNDTVIDVLIQCSQDMPITQISSCSEQRLVKSRNKSKKARIDSPTDPYDVDTIDILRDEK